MEAQLLLLSKEVVRGGGQSAKEGRILERARIDVLITAYVTKKKVIKLYMNLNIF